jgi:S-DNA-T family DNA segregation ATPase FtsK/SpoIIIE
MADTLPEPYEPGPPQVDEQFDVALDDAETVIEAGPTSGVLVDPPVTTTFADIVSRADERRPIVPASLRTKTGRQALVTYLTGMAVHEVLFQLSRSWMYAGKLGWYGPIGLFKGMWRLLKWAWHPTLTSLEQTAASRGDLDHGGRLAEQAGDARKTRFLMLLFGLVATAAGALLVRFMAPAWVPWVAAFVALFLLARIGKPSDKPFFERAYNASRYVRLTAELTRRALMAAENKIKEPGDVKFNREIYRDGPGYTAEVSLPTGIIATDIIERRAYLAAGFQLPLAQVWPEPVAGAHPGVLGVWVADRPVDRMKQPPSPLLTAGQLDYWGPLPWGFDMRLRPIDWRVDERNSLFGGMPGSGKTLDARNVGLAAALDPLVQFAISELKGSGDFDAMERLCRDGMYASGADQASKLRTMQILYWLDKECEVRGPKIRKWAKKGLNSQNKLNRAIAEADPSLPPIMAIFDEIQELLTDPDLGKEAADLITSIVKRGRSLGIHLILATQRIDSKSVPTGISSNVSTRMCLAVPSHKEVELVLGTGYYKMGYRPTAFIPPPTGDNPWAGWGYLAGLPTPIRAAYVDNQAAEDIVARAIAMRGGLVPDAEKVQARDMLADAWAVLQPGEPGMPWQVLADRLAERWPEFYAGITADMVRESLERYDVPSQDVKVKVDGAWKTIRGVRRASLETAKRQEIGVS